MATKKRRKAVKKKAGKKEKIQTQKRRKRGMTPFEPTVADRELVEKLVGFGMTQRQICYLVKNPRTGKGIDVNTLEKHFPKELASEGAKVAHEVVESLVNKARSADHPQAVTAAIWFTKARMGWRGEQRFEVDVRGNSGVMVAPAVMTPEEFAKTVREEEAGRESPDEV